VRRIRTTRPAPGRRVLTTRVSCPRLRGSPIRAKSRNLRLVAKTKGSRQRQLVRADDFPFSKRGAGLRTPHEVGNDGIERILVEGFPVRRVFAGMRKQDLERFVHTNQLGEVEDASGEPRGCHGSRTGTRNRDPRRLGGENESM
jgi:hypothetical protein